MVLMNEAVVAGDEGRSADLLAVVESYFELADTLSTETLDLFAEDVQIYFPVFGIRTGKAAFGSFVQGFSPRSL
jgi:hypothetical protein